MSTIPHQGFVHGEFPSVCTNPDHDVVTTEPREFIGRTAGMDRCHPCWYTAAMGSAHDDFMPLGAELDRLHVPWWVEQTGGMVMCLRIDLPGEKHILVSDIDEWPEWGEYGAGIYSDDEDAEGEWIPWKPLEWVVNDHDDAFIEYNFTGFAEWLRNLAVLHGADLP